MSLVTAGMGSGGPIVTAGLGLTEPDPEPIEPAPTVLRLRPHSRMPSAPALQSDSGAAACCGAATCKQVAGGCGCRGNPANQPGGCGS